MFLRSDAFLSTPGKGVEHTIILLNLTVRLQQILSEMEQGKTRVIDQLRGEEFSESLVGIQEHY